MSLRIGLKLMMRMKKMIFNEFKNKWNNIPPESNGYLSIDLEHPLQFHIGYSSSANKCILVMNVKKINNIPSSKSIRASNVDLINGSSAIEFQLLKDGLEDEFLHLCWDMVNYSRCLDNPLEKLIDRYISWMKLLQEWSDDSLIEFRQKGLIGELLHFEELQKRIGIEKTVKCWSGPDGMDQDFIYDYTWDEVKTVNVSSDTVSISSIQQLDMSYNGHLNIIFLDKTTPENKNGISLQELVERLHLLFRNEIDLLDTFNMKLYKYGYREKHADIYLANKYVISDKYKYLVSESFPRLTKSNIPNGITNATYKLSLQAIEKYRV